MQSSPNIVSDEESCKRPSGAPDRRGRVVVEALAVARVEAQRADLMENGFDEILAGALLQRR